MVRVVQTPKPNPQLQRFIHLALLPNSPRQGSYSRQAMELDPGFLAAIAEAKAGAQEGGVPIGACLVSQDGKILGKGRNMRVQRGSATLHV